MNYYNIPSIRINHSDYLRKLSKLTDHAFEIFIDNFHGNIMLKIIYCVCMVFRAQHFCKELIDIHQSFLLSRTTNQNLYTCTLNLSYICCRLRISHGYSVTMSTVRNGGRSQPMRGTTMMMLIGSVT